MMAIHWRPYRSGDEEYLTENKWVERYTDGWTRLKNNLKVGNLPLAFTFVDTNEQVHGIGGFIPYNEKSAEVFTVINTPSLSLVGIPRAVRSCLHKMQEVYGFTRVFATCRVDEGTDLHQWFTFLGMEREAAIEAWEADGSSVYFYKRIVRGVE